MSLIAEVEQKTMKSSELFWHMLAMEKTNVIFGSVQMIGNRFLHELHDKETMKYITLQHEQAAVHAADGYARATGKPGVVFIPAKAGITKAITGIATAAMDSVPLVIFVYQENSDDETVKTDIYGLTLPIAKHYFQLNESAAIQETVEKAFAIASDGRPGPVIVEIASKLESEVGCERNTEHHFQQQKEKYSTFSRKMINQIKQEIKEAKKPVLFIGGGVNISDAGELAAELAEKAQMPVVSSLMGLGAVPSKHPLFLGMLGMHGTFAANKAVHQADLLLCLGVRFSDRVTGKVSGFSPKSKKIQVDIDPAEINKIIPVDIPITGDAKAFLSQLLEEEIRAEHSKWVSETTSWKRTAPGIGEAKSLLKPQEILQLLNHHQKEVSVVATDVGQHQMWTAIHYQFDKSRTLLTSGGLGTMGYGLPAAIGAAFACEAGRSVLCISGDGSLQMNIQELSTIVKYQLPIKLVLLNNGYLGMVRQWQEMFYDRRYSSVKMASPDFIHVAEAYGITAKRAANLNESKALLEEAFCDTKPFIMEFDIIDEENVFPIVPPGKNNTEALLQK